MMRAERNQNGQSDDGEVEKLEETSRGLDVKMKNARQRMHQRSVPVDVVRLLALTFVRGAGIVSGVMSTLFGLNQSKTMRGWSRFLRIARRAGTAATPHKHRE